MDSRKIARDVSGLADAYVTSFLDAFPYQAVVIGARERHPSVLADHSLPALKKWQDKEDELLASLKAINVKDIEGLPEENTYKFLQELLQSSIGYRVCRMELWNVSPTYTGWQADLPVAAGMQNTDTPADQQNAIARWSQVPQYLDDEIANLKEGLRLGYTAPKGNVQSVINQVNAMIAAPIDDSPFVQMAKAGSAPSFRKALADAERASVRPAITRYRDFLVSTYLPAAREAIGVKANPDGAACYAAAVKYHATVDMPAQQIHDLGRAQMDKILAEMKEIGQRSFGVEDPAALLKLVKTDPKYRFKSRDELIKTAESAVARAKDALPKWFGMLPMAPVIVEPYPAFLEKTAPGGQAVPPPGGGKPGKYLINAYKATDQSRAGLEATAFHEAYPGHHLQIALALESENLHPISRYFYVSGYTEGWGLYSERLADEMGLYSGDLDRLGLLSNEALRAARLVVDSGMHMLGWTRQQAIDYVLAHTTETQAGAEAEIDRYIGVPGQATAYMIGNLEIRKLRDEARQKLGAKFDIRQFHDIVLEGGSVPLWVLRDNVERWIADTLAPKK
ncbi:MAG TPA: DUF885 domain-containing protein [Vicinamibacterales bacterium]|nr:DUF885 domain-containing protein [Vicinamibacterales bacterium]